MKDVLCYKLLKPGETINAVCYSNQLLYLCEKIEKKRSFTSQGTQLLHDNAHPHVALSTKQTIFDLGWKVLPHAAYSSDLAPSDYHLFRSLQHTLSDQRFANIDDIKNCIDNFIVSKLKSFFERRIQKLPDLWAKVIESQGKYFDD